jgi:hypothetical protein
VASNGCDIDFAVLFIPFDTDITESSSSTTSFNNNNDINNDNKNNATSDFLDGMDISESDNNVSLESKWRTYDPTADAKVLLDKFMVDRVNKTLSNQLKSNSNIKNSKDNLADDIKIEIEAREIVESFRRCQFSASNITNGGRKPQNSPSSGVASSMQGSFTALLSDGICRLVFDNSYSIFIGKHVDYLAQIVSPATMQAALDASTEISHSKSRIRSVLYDKLLQSTRYFILIILILLLLLLIIIYYNI